MMCVARACAVPVLMVVRAVFFPVEKTTCHLVQLSVSPLSLLKHTSRRYTPDEKAREVLERSILTRALIEVWGEGGSQDELNAAIQAFPEDRKQPYCAEGTTFKVCVEDFGKTERGTKVGEAEGLVANASLRESSSVSPS